MTRQEKQITALRAENAQLKERVKFLESLALKKQEHPPNPGYWHIRNPYQVGDGGGMPFIAPNVTC